MIRLTRKDTPCHGIKVPNMVQFSEQSTLGVSNMNSNVFGVDIAKQVFQIHWVDQETGEIHSDKVKRKDFVQYFANCERRIKYHTKNTIKPQYTRGLILG